MVVIKRFSLQIAFSLLAISLVLDLFFRGKTLHIYLIPVIFAASTLPLTATVGIAALAGACNLLIFPESNVVAMLSHFMMLITIAVLIKLLILKQAQKDNQIQDLRNHLGLNESLHDIILHDSQIAFEVVDKAGRIITWNERAAQLTRLPDALGLLHQDLFCQTTDNGQNLILDTLNTGREYFDKEITLQLPGNESVTALVNSYVIKDKHGRTLGALAFYRDITNRRLVERQEQQSEKYAALGQLAFGLAHEIRNPLTTVQGFLQLMLADGYNSKYSEYHKIMLQEVNKTNQLISDFTVLANPSVPVLRRVILRKLVGKVFTAVSPKALQNNIRLDNQVSSFSNPYLDEEQFWHILIQFAENAIDAMPNGGTFGIKTKIVNDFERITIWDTGEGVRQEHVNKIFDPFFTTKDSSAGLGLAMAYNIIKSHGGEIAVQSQPGSGTAFNIFLPIDQVSSNLPMRKSS